MPNWPLSDAERARRREIERYREATGHDPPEIPEHPLVHQWDYRGTKEEREALKDELFAETDPEPVPFIEGQESLL